MEAKLPKTVHGVRLFHCPELNAFVSPKQCKANRAKLKLGDRTREGVMARVFCLSCPGVELVWERTRRRTTSHRHRNVPMA
jgi:hypothetical protein